MKGGGGRGARVGGRLEEEMRSEKGKVSDWKP